MQPQDPAASRSPVVSYYYGYYYCYSDGYYHYYYYYFYWRSGRALARSGQPFRSAGLRRHAAYLGGVPDTTKTPPAAEAGGVRPALPCFHTLPRPNVQPTPHHLRSGPGGMRGAVK